MQAFQRDIDLFEKHHAQVLGISSDSLETHLKFSRQYQVSFSLVTDSDGTLKKLYGRGRITYIIDKTGMIRYQQKGVPENGTLLRVLDTLDE